MQVLDDALGHCLQKGLTFVLFRWQGGTELWVQHPPHLERLSMAELAATTNRFIVAPFHGNNDHVFALRPDVRISTDRSEWDPAELLRCTGHSSCTGTQGPVWAAEGHAQAIADAQHLFATSDLRKVVLARTIAVPLAPDLLLPLFHDACARHPDAFVCLLNCPEYGTWLGASPERLIQAEQDQVTVDSIAGTMPWEDAPRTVAGWGAKERDEQELVTDAVRGALLKHTVQDLQISGPEVLHAGPVAHLHTRLTGIVRSASLASLAQALHPTPAVCGTPRESALRFILEHEPQDRGLYAGYWGPWKVDGSSLLHVNIRCLQAFADSASIHVGGGITAGSKAGHEWQETEQKALTWTAPMKALAGRIP